VFAYPTLPRRHLRRGRREVLDTCFSASAELSLRRAPACVAPRRRSVDVQYELGTVLCNVNILSSGIFVSPLVG